MRLIGHVNAEAAARTLGDYLYAQGIENRLEADRDHGWAVWIYAEEDVERARALLAEFQADPEHPKFRAAVREAAALRKQREREAEAWARKVKPRRSWLLVLHEYGFGPVTLALMVACVVVFVIADFGRNPERVLSLFISEFFVKGNWVVRLKSLFRGLECLPEVRHGQVWRLMTPILVHFHFLHIFFNLLWLRDLGGMIEGRLGSRFFLLQVLGLAVVSNVAQYVVGGPTFGGMSGVVYGLLGYVWIRGRLDPALGLFLHSYTVAMMIIWFLVCLAGLVGNVANTAHAAGLAMGMSWAWWNARRNH